MKSLSLGERINDYHKAINDVSAIDEAITTPRTAKLQNFSRFDFERTIDWWAFGVIANEL